jgi:hypothetical protein
LVDFLLRPYPDLTRGSQDVPIGGLEVARAIVVKKASRTAMKKPVAGLVHKATSKARKPGERIAAQVVAHTLPTAMTGRASPAKAADGDKPVFAYICSLPQPQRGIAERVDALAAKTLPGLKRSVKWGIAWYGVGDGCCFCCGGFAGHVKLTFGRGTALKPVPPVTPVGMAPVNTRPCMIRKRESSGVCRRTVFLPSYRTAS